MQAYTQYALPTSLNCQAESTLESRQSCVLNSQLHRVPKLATPLQINWCKIVNT